MAKMRKTKVEEMDSLAETDRLVMKQQGKQWIQLASIAIIIVVAGREDDEEGSKKAKMRKKQAVKIDSLSKKDGLFMEQQGKTIN